MDILIHRDERMSRLSKTERGGDKAHRKLMARRDETEPRECKTERMNCWNV